MELTYDQIKAEIQKILNDSQYRISNHKRQEIEKQIEEGNRIEGTIKNTVPGERKELEGKFAQIKISLCSDIEEIKQTLNVTEFINRTDELSYITSHLCPPYLLISSPTGYGKTRLLETIKDQLKNQNWLCMFLKLKREASYDISTLTNAILEQLEHRSDKDIGGGTLQEMGNQIGKCILEKLKSNKQEQAILIIDTAELLEQEVAKKFLNQCVSVLGDVLTFNHVTFRLIVAGRYISKWLHMGLNIPLEEKETFLTPFDFKAVYQTVEHMFVSKSQLKLPPDYKTGVAFHLMYFTGGHPGAMAEILSKDFGSPIPVITAKEEEYYTTIIQPSFIKEIQDNIPPDLKKSFEILCVVRRFNTRLLQHFLEKKIITAWKGDAYELADALLETYLVNKKEGFLQDDITRRLLAIHLRKENLKTFIKVCQQSIRFYTAMLQDPASYRPDIIAVELLFQKLQYISYKQHGNKEQFLESVNEILNALVLKREQHVIIDIMDSFKERLKQDWEFQFMLNYLLRDRVYDDAPFQELMREIDHFMKDLQEGKHA